MKYPTAPLRSDCLYLRQWAIAVAVLTVTCALSPAPSFALTEKGTYDVQTQAQPDAQAGGWYINLGITGARGKMTPAAPTVMEVAYVFKGTPAYGKLKRGDKIIGANGRLFKTPHKFGYGPDKFGYEGPMMDIGNALEESQGSRLNGKLTFKVKRGSQTMDIELRISTRYGQFGKTFPFNDKKTDMILGDVYKYLLQRQRSNGTWSRLNVNVFAALALLASGRPEYVAASRKAMQQFAKETGPRVPDGGLQNWRYTLYGMALAEFYLATGEKWVLPELLEIRQALMESQFMDPVNKTNGAADNSGGGGWGHNRNFEGYGPINILTGQGLAAYGLMQQCGIDIPKNNIAAAHTFIDRGTNKIGYVWYKDGGKRNGSYADMGRTGIAAIAHNVNPVGGQMFIERAKLHATCIGKHYKTFHDTHGSPLLGMAWTSLGAAVDPVSYRTLMDNNKWLINLSQNPDGTFYYQPNRDNNPQAYGAGPRITATCTMSLILAMKFRSLSIMGAQRGIGGLELTQLSRPLRSAHDQITKDRFTSAYQSLVRMEKNTRIDPKEKKAIEVMKEHISSIVDTALQELKDYDRIGDVVKVEALIKTTRVRFRGIGDVDKVLKEMTISLVRDETKREQLRIGKQYESLVIRAQKSPVKNNIHALERFAARYPDSIYGKAAKDAVEQLKFEDRDHQQKLRDVFFEKLLKENKNIEVKN